MELALIESDIMLFTSNLQKSAKSYNFVFSFNLTNTLKRSLFYNVVNFFLKKFALPNELCIIFRNIF